MSTPGDSLDDGRIVTVAHAIEQFFGTLRLAPRTQKAYRIGLRRFVELVAREAECEVAAVHPGAGRRPGGAALGPAILTGR